MNLKNWTVVGNGIDRLRKGRLLLRILVTAGDVFLH